MTKQIINEPLTKVEGIQFLRSTEVKFLRALNRLFIQRKRNDYRKDILGIVTNETIRHIVRTENVGGLNTYSALLYNLIDSLKNTALIKKHGPQSTFKQYKQVHPGGIKMKTFPDDLAGMHYEFDLVKTNQVVKLLNSIDYLYLGLSGRVIIGALSTVQNKDDWFKSYDIVVNSDNNRERTLTDTLRVSTNTELIKRVLEVDKSNKATLYKLTEFGKLVIDVCEQISDLLERPHEQQESIPSSSGILESAAYTAD